MSGALGAAEAGRSEPRAGDSDWRIYRRLLGYVRPHLSFFVLSFVGFVIYSGSNVGFAELLRVTIDTVRSYAEGAEVGNARWLIPLGMIAAVFARGVGSFLGSYFLSVVGAHVVHRLRCQLFDQLLVLPTAFFDRNTQGHLVSRVTYNVSQVTGAATKALEVITREGLTVLGLAAYMLWTHWTLALIFFAAGPVIALVITWAGRRFRRFSRRIQSSMGDVTHVAAEAINAYREVRIFGGQSYERARFHRSSHYNRRQSVKLVATKAMSTPVVQLLVAMALALLVWLILSPAMLAELSAGDVVAFVTAAGMLAKPLRQLSEVNAVIQQGLAAAHDIFAQFEERAEPDTGTFDPGRVAGRIELDRVRFTYARSNAPAVNDVSFAIESGETIALVGRSGSGKSTLVGMIPRFHEPGAGEIRIDGVAIEGFARSALRRQIALVSQNVTLFNDTVARNIAYGGLADSSREAIEAAARRAHATEFIERLPEGLDTLIGDDGVLLSGGQRQRLAIARAVLKDAPILILDEATAALDSESEAHIQAALQAVMRDRTTIVIAHRLSTIERADRILILEHGHLVEQGAHAELLAQDGLYAKLHRRQFGDGPAQPATVEGSSASHEVDRQDHSREGRGIADAWYGDARWPCLLAPVSAVLRWEVRRRRRRFLTGSATWRAPVPVLVVGNVTAGGTGKTPLVLWMVTHLLELGARPGVAARGYGGRASAYPLDVDAQTPAESAGDEAPLIAARTGVPVAVAPDRTAAVARLVERGVEVVVCDDGLQHYALERDLEIAVLDGERGTGNGRCLPAGPLREPLERLDAVDFVVSTGTLRGADAGRAHFELTLEPRALVALADGAESAPEPVEPGEGVHAVAGIGHPERFFTTLQALGFELQRHAHSDHQSFDLHDLDFEDELRVIMTEKDAVRARPIVMAEAELVGRCLALRVDCVPSPDFAAALDQRLTALGIPDNARHRPAASGAAAEASGSPIR